MLKKLNNRKRGRSLIPPVAYIQVLLKNTSSLLLISRYPDTCVLEEEEWDGRYLVLPKNAVGDLIRWITHRGTSAPAREREREAQSWVESSLIPDKMGRSRRT